MAHIEVTTRIGCPIRCKYCPQSLLSCRYNELFPNAPKMLSYETFEKCLINLGPERGVHFTGFAEPWSNPDCTRFLLLAIEQK